MNSRTRAHQLIVAGISAGLAGAICVRLFAWATWCWAGGAPIIWLLIVLPINLE